MDKSGLPRFRKQTIAVTPSEGGITGSPRSRWHSPRVVVPFPSHPLAGERRRPGIPITIVILIGWLVWRGWTAESIGGLLLICMPELAVAARPTKRTR